MEQKVCKNCGADSGLHHYQTMQCPVGGVEAPIGRKQEWMTSTYEERDPVRDAAPVLLAALELAALALAGWEEYWQLGDRNAYDQARAAIAKAKAE